MSTPAIPDEAKPFLQYLPMIANFIRTNRKPTRGELSLLRSFAPDGFRRLKSFTYDEVIAFASLYQTDPELGVYARLVMSEEGRAWLADVLALVQSM